MEILGLEISIDASKIIVSKMAKERNTHETKTFIENGFWYFFLHIYVLFCYFAFASVIIKSYDDRDRRWVNETKIPTAFAGCFYQSRIIFIISFDKCEQYCLYIYYFSV